MLGIAALSQAFYAMWSAKRQKGSGEYLLGGLIPHYFCRCAQCAPNYEDTMVPHHKYVVNLNVKIDSVANRVCTYCAIGIPKTYEQLLYIIIVTSPLPLMDLRQRLKWGL